MARYQQWTPGAGLDLVDVSFRAGAEIGFLRFQVSNVARLVRRSAQRMLALSAAIIGSALILLVILMTFWITTSEPSSGSSIATGSWSPTSTILLDSGR